MMKIILTGIFIFIFIILFCAAMAYLFDFFKSVSQFIEKRKRKKIIKKLKEEAEYGKICADILRNKIIESKEEEKNDRN